MITLELIKNSIVLVRVNYDLPSLIDTDRISDSLDTIRLLLKNRNKVILATHWGRPNCKFIESLSTKNLLDTISRVFKSQTDPILKTAKLHYINQFQSFSETRDYIRNFPENESKNTVFLLENTRFHPMEQSKSQESRQDVAKQYAVLAEDFVDEAFAVSHRNEATNCEIKAFLRDCNGLAYEKEITNLNKLKEQPASPFYIVMAGSKLETKLPLISALLPKADKILLGGILCFTFIQALKELQLSNHSHATPELFDSPVETGFMDTAKNILKQYPDKILLPLDLVYEGSDGKKLAMDIGPATIAYYGQVLEQAATIFWNGTMGYYEKSPFDQGTLQLATKISELDNAFRVIGGGDTNSALPHDITKKFNFVSMGGGATLDFLSK